MSKKGFTLVELLGVLVLLSVIVVVAFPSILGTIQGTKKQIDDATERLLIANARSYVTDTEPAASGCVTVHTLIEEAYTETPIANQDSEKSETIANYWSVSYEYQNGKYVNFQVRETGC